MWRTLVAHLSIAASDEEKIRDVLEAALQWEYSKHENSVYALYLMTPKIAIIFATKELVEALLSREEGDFQLGGPLSARFASSENFPSNCLQIKFDESFEQNQQPRLIQSLQNSFESFSVFQLEDGFNLRFPTPETATEAASKIRELASSDSVVRNIYVSELLMLRGRWKGSLGTSFSTTTQRLRNSGQNITSLVQSCLSVRSQQPLLLSIQAARRSGRSDSFSNERFLVEADNTILVLPSKDDAQLLLDIPVVELVGGAVLSVTVFSPEQLKQFTPGGSAASASPLGIAGKIPAAQPSILSVPPTGLAVASLSSPTSPKSALGLSVSSLTGPLPSMQSSLFSENASAPAEIKAMDREIHVLWDYEKCPLAADDDASLVAQNIVSVLSSFISSRQSIGPGGQINGLHFFKIVFLCSDMLDANHRPSPRQLSLLSEESFQVVSYSKRIDFDATLNEQVNEIVSTFRASSRSESSSGQEKPCVCVLSDDVTFGSSSAILRLEGFNDVIFMFSDDTIGQLTSLVTAVYPWSSVRRLHKLSTSQLTEFLQNSSRTNGHPSGFDKSSNASALPSPPNASSSGLSYNAPVFKPSNPLPLAADMSRLSMNPAPYQYPQPGSRPVSGGAFGMSTPTPPLPPPFPGVPGLGPRSNSLPPQPIQQLGQSARSQSINSRQTFFKADGGIPLKAPTAAMMSDSSQYLPISALSAESKRIVTDPTVIELQWLSVATHFRNLIIWGDEYYNTVGSSVDSDESDSRPSSANGSERSSFTLQRSRVLLSSVVTSHNWLMGERSFMTLEEEASEAAFDESTPAEKVEKSTSVVLTLDSKKRVYQLKVCGNSMERVERRHKRLLAMVTTAIRDRKLHTLERCWEPQHRECIMGSSLIQSEEKNLQSTALFHYNEGTIIVEIVSLHSKNHRSLLVYLENLGPTSTYWSVPREILGEMNDRRWAEFRQRFAVLVDKEQLMMTMKGVAAAMQRPNVAVHVWGFESSLEEAHSFLIKSKNASSAARNVALDGIGRVGSMATPALAGASSAQSIPAIPQATVPPALVNPQIPYASRMSSSIPAFSFHSPAPPGLSIPVMNSSPGALNPPPAQQPPIPPPPTPPQAPLFKFSINQVPRPDAVVEKKLPIPGSFTFQDRDAGIYYQTFEPQFRHYISKSFDVQIAEAIPDPAAVEALRAKTENASPSTINRVNLRVDFSGSSNGDIAACRSYLEQLHSTALVRHQVYFPNCDASRYRELLNHKAKQDQALKNIRQAFSGDDSVDPKVVIAALADRPDKFDERTSGAAPETLSHTTGTDDSDGLANLGIAGHNLVTGSSSFGAEASPSDNPIDPLDRDGFVCIRLKPPLHSRGIKRMTLPASVTVTICGPTRSDTQKQVFHRLMSYYENISSGYYCGAIDLPPSSTMVKQLTIRSSRDEYIHQKGIVGLRYEESLKNPNLIAGVVKVWMSSYDTLVSVLLDLESHGGIGPRVVSTPQCLPDTKNLVPTPLDRRSSFNSRESSLNEPDSSGQNQLSPNVSPGGVEVALTAASPRLEQPELIKPESGLIIPTVVTDKEIIRWPHPSFRFMFLGEPLKRSLNDLLQNLRVMHGVASTCPYRDKSDHAACLLLVGCGPMVGIAAQEVARFMHIILQNMRCIHIIMSDIQKKILIAQDLIKVKDVQGRCGVHVVLDPLSVDSADATSCYDLRLPFSPALLETDSIAAAMGVTPIEHEPSECISVLVNSSKQMGSGVVVSIMNNKSGASGWNWGVNNVLLMLDPSADMGLNMTEIEQLDSGEVLVNTEAASGKRILRVRANKSSFHSDFDGQVSGFISALSRGLAAVESLRLTGVAVVAPTGTQIFPDLPPDLIRSLTVEGVVNFVRRAPLQFLEKVLCIEITPNDDLGYISQVDGFNIDLGRPSDSFSILPGGGDRMAMTLMMLLEQANDPSVNASLSMQGIPLPAIQLLECNIPLPLTLPAEALVPGISGPAPQGMRMSRPPLNPKYPYAGSGACTILVRGLPGALLQAVRHLRRAVLPSM